VRYRSAGRRLILPARLPARCLRRARMHQTTDDVDDDAAQTKRVPQIAAPDSRRSHGGVVFAQNESRRRQLADCRVFARRRSHGRFPKQNGHIHHVGRARVSYRERAACNLLGRRICFCTTFLRPSARDATHSLLLFEFSFSGFLSLWFVLLCSVEEQLEFTCGLIFILDPNGQSVK
jgi:hypothetical protein